MRTSNTMQNLRVFNHHLPSLIFPPNFVQEKFFCKNDGQASFYKTFLLGLVDSTAKILYLKGNNFKYLWKFLNGI